MRVLHVTKGGGGLDVYIGDILDSLPPEIEQAVVCNPAHGNLYEKCVAEGRQVFPVAMEREIRPHRDLRHMVEIWRILQEWRPDLVHLHSSKAGALCRPLCRALGIPTIYTPHAAAYLGMEGWKRQFFLWIERLLSPFTNLVLANSPSEAEALRKDLFLSESSIDYCMNGLDLGQLDRLRPEAREKHRGRVVMLARLLPQKNPLMFVDVAERVAMHVPEANFHLIGAGLDDFLGPQVRAAIAAKNLELKVAIHGWMPREEALGFLASSEVAVATSIFESFGYFVAEAQALGIPVVATDILGFKDIVEPGRTGYLVSPDETRQMADHIIRLLRDDELRKDFGDHAIQRARRLLSWKRIHSIASTTLDCFSQTALRSRLGFRFGTWFPCCGTPFPAS